MNRASTLLLLACFACVASTRVAFATTFVVDTETDDLTVNGNCSLREAIRAATTNTAIDDCGDAGTAADTILLPDGTYGMDVLPGPELVTAGGALEIRSESLDPSTVDVDLGNVNRMLMIDAPAGPVTLRGFTVRNGLGTSIGPNESAAVNARDVDLRIERMRFVDNHTPTLASAVRKVGDGALEIVETEFTGNSAAQNAGAVQISAAGANSRASLRDVSFASNHITSSSGANGGALYAFASGSGSSIECLRCSFVGNSIASSNGIARGSGAYLVAWSDAIVRLVDSRFVGNTASGPQTSGTQTPGFYASASTGGQMLLDRVLVDDSTVAEPGHPSWDVYLIASFGGVLTFTNGQVTRGNGNGVFAAFHDGSVELGQLTIAGYEGGTGIRLEAGAFTGSIALRNSLLADNMFDWISNTTPTMSGNCIAMGANFPNFADESEGDYRLASDSAAVDAGLDGQPHQRPYDLAHAPRLIGPHPDCGAYELGALFGDGFESGDTGSWSAVAD